MIYINCPTQQDYIKELLENNTTDVHFKFESKTGIKMAFSIDTEDVELAIATAKTLIKSSPLGAALYFQVTK